MKGEIKGADRAKGENEMYDGREINFEGGNQGIRRKKEGTKRRRNIQGHGGKIKGAAIAKGEIKMRERP